MSSSTTDKKISGDIGNQIPNGTMTKIQNAYSHLFAYAPNEVGPDGKAPLLVEPDSFQFAANELVRMFECLALASVT